MKQIWTALAMVLVLSGCGGGAPGEKLVREQLAAESDGKIKITVYDGPAAWTAADSLKILKDSLEREKASRIASLEKAIESSNKAIEGAQKVKEGGFSALDGMADQTIQDAEMTIAAAEMTLVALHGDFKGTSLEGLYKRVQHHEDAGDQVLYQILEGTWSAGDEEKPFRYKADPELTQILGELN